MIKHIVMFRIPAELKDKNTLIQALKDKLDNLKNKIPRLKKLETGINISKRTSAFDLVLVTEFDNESDLDVYRKHPDHLEVVAYIEKIKAEVVVADYIF